MHADDAQLVDRAQRTDDRQRHRGDRPAGGRRARLDGYTRGGGGADGAAGTPAGLAAGGGRRGWLRVLRGGLHVGMAWRGEGAAAIAGEIVVSLRYAAIGIYLLGRAAAGGA